MKNEAWAKYGVVIFSLLTFSFSGVMAAEQKGDGDFVQGLAYYKGQNYTAARQAFEKALVKYPKSWQVQLYLGHCYLVTGRNAQAKQAYETCLSLTQDGQAIKACQGGIERLNRSGLARAEAPKKAEGEEVADKGEAKAGADADAKAPKISAQEERIVRQKEAVMKQAETEVKRLREEGKEILEQEKNLHGQRWRDPDTGEKFFDITEDRKQQLQLELEQRCRKVMEEAEKKASFIH